MRQGAKGCRLSMKHDEMQGAKKECDIVHIYMHKCNLQMFILVIDKRMGISNARPALQTSMSDVRSSPPPLLPSPPPQLIRDWSEFKGYAEKEFGTNQNRT